MKTKERNELRRTILEYYSEIKFNDSLHRYTIDDVELKSCTKIVSSYETEFNADFHAKRIANATVKDAKYEGMSANEIKDAWEENRNNALSRGNRLHNDLESKSLDSKHSIQSEFKKPINKFFRSIAGRYKIIVPELRMYYKELGICGTCDVLAIDLKTGKYCLLDYKQGKDIVKIEKYTKDGIEITSKFNLKRPFNKYPKSNYYKYSIQLSIYRYMLLKTIGIEVEDMFIVHFTLEGFTMHKAELMPVEKIFEKATKTNKKPK